MEEIVGQSAEVSERALALTVALTERFVTWVATSGLRILLILALAWVVWIVIRRLVGRIQGIFAGQGDSIERTKRANTISSVLHTTAAILLGIAAMMMILRETGVDIAPILATAGIGGLAIGFGAQSLVKDVISGFFLLIEDQVRIGDVVQVAGRGGVVEGIGLRTLRLRDQAGSVHVIPNGHIDVVTNMTKDFSHYVLDVGVAYREDTDEVVEALVALDAELREDPVLGPDILRPIEVMGVDRFADSAVIVKARLTTKPIRQWAVGREFNRRMKKRFDEIGIEIPFPHLTVYAGASKNGAAPPFRIAQSETDGAS
jgi:moderate conductance mechanosensitive channel